MDFKKIAAIVSLVSTSYFANAQTEGVSISGTVAPPDPSAMLDVQSTSKGLLIPRVILTGLTTASPIQTPVAEGLIVYNFGTTISKGFYYWDGTSWIKIGEGLWSKIGSSNDIKYAFGKVQVGSTGCPLPTFDFEVNYPDPGHNNISKFEGSVGVLNFGTVNSMPATGHGPLLIGECYLHQSAKADPNGIGYKVSYDQLAEDGTKMLSLNSDIGETNLYTAGAMSIQSDGIDLQSAGGDITLETPTTIVFSPNNIVSAWFDPSGNFVNPSDSTLKTNITDLPSVLTKIKNCRPITYNWKKNPSGEKNYGFIAQELEQQFPELVSEHIIPATPGHPATTIKGINYEGLSSILLKGMKEQQAKIESLEQRIQALENH